MNTNIFEKIIITIKREGVYPAFKKIFLRVKYIYYRYRYSNNLESQKWEGLKDKYKGERVFLIGNGPSLNKTKLYYLKNEYTLCFNRFHILVERLNWFPTFYMITDDLVLEDMLNEVESISRKVEYSFYPDIHFRGTNFKSKMNDRDNIYWLEQKHGQNFSVELPKAYLGGSVIYEGFQVLNYLGFDEIYFVGVDMNFKIHQTAKEINGKQTDVESNANDDPNHFDPRYFGKDKKYHQPEDYVVNFIMKNLKYLSTVADKFGLSIINAGYDSKVEYFPKVDFEELFDSSTEEKEKLFNECLSQNTKYNSVSEFLAEAEHISDKEQFTKRLGNFYINKEEGISLISKAIFSHIPYGPYGNRYYFVKRHDTDIN